MKPYASKYRKVRDHRQTRCIHCGRWIDLLREKTCPKCGKRSLARADKRCCDDCHTRLTDGDFVCPFCGSKQRPIVELRGLKTENLTAFAHLLHDGQPSVSLAECRKRCRSITAENPYRLSFHKKAGRIKPFIQAWNALGGTAVACLPRETSRRPIVLLRSYNTRRDIEHARLLFEAVQKSDRPWLTIGETFQILHSIHQSETPIRIRFTSDFDHIDTWVASWRSLGGTAVRSHEHM